MTEPINDANIKALYNRPDNFKDIIDHSKPGDTGKIVYSFRGVKKVSSYEVFNVPGRKMFVFVTVPLADVEAVIATVGINAAFLSIIIVLSASIGLLTFLAFYQQHKSAELQATKDEFVSLASHQLRTPATGVKTFLGIMLEGYTGRLTEEQQKMLQKANDSNDRQLLVIDDLLNVARLDSGRMKMDFKQVEIVGLVNSIMAEQTGTIQSRGQTIKLQSPAKLEIRADAIHLRMSIENLISNASKYSPSGTVIDVEIAETLRDVEISIQDQGLGIADQDKSKLFKKFSRVQNKASTTTPGTGLGLYLCRQIVNLHGGDIVVSSQIGHGSRFTIKLPKKGD